MTKIEAIELLDKLEKALANGRIMINAVKPINDFMEEPKVTYEEGKHDGYLIGMYDGIESSMGMVEHFQDLIELNHLEGFDFKD